MTKREKPESSAEHLKTTVKAILPIMKFIGLFNPKIRDATKKMSDEVSKFERIESSITSFGSNFGPRGWVIYDNISTTHIDSALTATDENAAEELLNEYFIEEHFLARLGYVFHQPDFQAWQLIYQRAHHHAMTEDYISAIPLLMMITDGICQRYLNMSPYSGATNKEVFDTITSAPNGLSDAFKVHGVARMKKMQTEPIESPFRNGIMHGNDTNYGYKIVCAKSVNLLAATIDYVKASRSEDERIDVAIEDRRLPKLSELAQKLKSTAEFKAASEAWVARPIITDTLIAKSNEAFELTTDTPEEAAANILSYIQSRNYGKLANATVNFNKQTLGKIAGKANNDLKNITLNAWRITGVEDKASASAFVDVTVSVEIDSRISEHDFRMFMNYESVDRSPIPRGLGGGIWRVSQSFITDIWRLSLPEE